MTIKTIREILGLTQTEFAAKIGTSQVAVSRWEKGVVRPGFDSLRRIADTIGCSIDDIDLPGKKLRARDIFTREAYEGLTAAERRGVLKVEQAKEYSGWRRYPTTCSKLVERIPDEWWDTYSAQHIGEVMALLKIAHDDGIAHGRAHEDA